MSVLWTVSFWGMFAAIAVAIYVAIREYDLLRQSDGAAEREDDGR